MSLYYPAGGATAALGVIGLCQSCLGNMSPDFKLTCCADMLFNGEGEAFNVR